MGGICFPNPTGWKEVNLTRALGEQREESAHQTEARTFRGRTFVRPKKEEVSAGSRRRGIHLPYIYILVDLGPTAMNHRSYVMNM